MKEAEPVHQMLALHELGWGTKRIAGELGVARNTVKRYLAVGGYVAYQSPARPGKLAGLEAWLREQFLRHRGNCDVVRQELARVHGQRQPAHRRGRLPVTPSGQAIDSEAPMAMSSTTASPLMAWP